VAGNVLECGSWKLGHILQIRLNLLFFTVDEVRGNNLENPYISWKLNSNCLLGNRGKINFYVYDKNHWICFMFGCCRGGCCSEGSL